MVQTMMSARMEVVTGMIGVDEDIGITNLITDYRMAYVCSN